MSVDPFAVYAMNTRDAKRPRTFLCRDELYAAFEARARQLECSVDWLLGEAMKRMLVDGALAPAPPRSSPSRLPPPPTRATLAPLPPPPPPPRRKDSFIGMRDGIAIRVGETRVVVDKERFVIGRSAKEAHFVVRDSSVSRQHAIVEREKDGTWVIVDMASTNGVMLNGTPVTRSPVRPGDVLVIGPVTLSIERA